MKISELKALLDGVSEEYGDIEIHFTQITKLNEYGNSDASISLNALTYVIEGHFGCPEDSDFPPHKLIKPTMEPGAEEAGRAMRERGEIPDFHELCFEFYPDSK